MTEPKIHDDELLNEVQYSESSDVYSVHDRESIVITSNFSIPGLIQYPFHLSVPYRVKGIDLFLTRFKHFGSKSIFHTWQWKDEPHKVCTVNDTWAKQDLELVTRLAERYIISKNNPTAKSRTHFTISINELLSCRAVFDQPQPALDDGAPLNAFNLSGIIYEAANWMTKSKRS